MKRIILAMIVVLIRGGAALALGPHEIALLVNGNSDDSIAVAQHYAALRGIPEQNVITFDAPNPGILRLNTISPGVFRKKIWEPVNRILAERGIADHVLAWVYSVDFPVRVSEKPGLSLHGMTFVRGEPPEFELIDGGMYRSPLYAGPEHSRDPVHRTQTLDVYKTWLKGGMPVPSMSLGYIGKGGNSMGEVRQCLQRGAQSDHTAPEGTIYFILTDDVRSQCRKWQYRGAREDLGSIGARSVILPRMPVRRPDVLGMQIGEAVVKPVGHTFARGVMAEHLTSAGAVFHGTSQTHLSTWITAGATASCGSVSEPYAIWSKFPNAHFYYHQRHGATILESFFQSIRCPLQLYMVGDPLAAPWAPAGRVVIGEEEDASIPPRRLIRPRVDGDASGVYPEFTFMLDGKVMHRGKVWLMPVGVVGSRLRVVAHRSGLVRHQQFAEKSLVPDV